MMRRPASTPALTAARERLRPTAKGMTICGKTTVFFSGSTE